MNSSVRIGLERTEMVDKLDINLSQYVRNCFDRDFKNPEKIKKEIEKFEKMIKYRKDLLEEINNEVTNLSVGEKDYLKESKLILEKHGFDSIFFMNRFKGFINTFNKKYVTLDSFKELIK